MDLVFNRTRKIPSKSWGQECSLCSSRHGVPIECSARGCKAAYHTTCAIRGKLKMQAIFGKNFKGGIKLRSYCKAHSPSINLEDGLSSQADKIDASGVKEIDMTNLADDRLQESNDELDYFWKYVDINEVHKNISDAYDRAKAMSKVDIDSIDHESATKKRKINQSKNDNLKTKKNNTPIKKGRTDGNTEPKVDNGVSHDVDPLMLDFIYRYWMLLRTANNGQSLIKFSPSALKEREFEQRKNIMKLRIELERVRNLSYMIGKREKLKVGWLRAHQNIIKRTFSVINDLHPVHDVSQNSNDMIDSSTNMNSIVTQQQGSSLAVNGRKSLQTTHLQPQSSMFDESDQLINDLITCDQIYELPSSSVNSNYSNLSDQERSTLERRRTLSLVRRINRQLKGINTEPPLNPYAKSYLALKRSDSPIGITQSQTCKILKYR